MNTNYSRLNTVRKRPGLAGYYAVMVVVVTIFTGLWLFEGHYLFTAWFPSLYDEITPINGVAAGGFMTLMLVCSVAALVRPERAIAPAKVLLVGGGLLGLLLPLAFVTSEPIYTLVLTSIAVVILGLVVGLHPVRHELLSRDAVDVDVRLLGLTILLAGPAFWLAGTLQRHQLVRDDEVAGRWFYGGLAMYLLAVLGLSALASLDARSRRFAAASAAFLAGALGIVSIVYPAELHSFGFAGGLALVGWGIALFVVAGLDR